MEKNTSIYTYHAVDSHGKKKKGEVEANSEERAYQLIKAQGMAPITIKNKSTDFLQKDIAIPGLERRAKKKALALFCKQFALLIKSGIPILESLRVVSEQTEDKVLKTALAQVSDDVEAGLPLSTAMEKHKFAFPTLLVSIVAVGESGGFLDRSFSSMAKSYQEEVELNQKVRSALMYPVIVVVLTSLIVTAMLIFVVPMFTKMFEGLGAELPLPTQILVAVSSKMVYIIPSVIIFLIIFIILYRQYKDEEWLRSRVDRWKLKVPVFGNLLRKLAITRFCGNLSMMIYSGTPLLRALEMVGPTTNNWVFENTIRNATLKVENGQSFSASIEKSEVFTPMVKNMVAVGENSGSMSVMLDTVKEFYDEEVKEMSENLSSAIEPFLIVFLGILIGSMLMALYMPMFTLFNAMSQG